MPPQADPASDEDDEIDTTEEQGADLGDALPKTDGDDAEPRSTDDAEPAEADDDDQRAKDPLVTAQLAPKTQDQGKPVPKTEPKPAAKATPPKPSATPAPSQPTNDEPPTSDKPKEEEPAPKDDDLALAQLPAEDWTKLTHKGRSVFLDQRRAVKVEREARTKAENEAKEARKNYESVETFVNAQKLEPDEYTHAVTLLGAVKRGDARAVPVLEQHLKALKTRLKIVDAPPQPAAPVLDDAGLDDLVAAAIAAYDDSSLDPEKAKEAARAKFAAIKGKQPAAAKPVTTPPPAPPVQREHQQDGGSADVETAAFHENEAIINDLIELGVAEGDALKTAVALVNELTGNGAQPPPPVGQRHAAVLKAFAKQARAQAPVRRAPAPPPLSGRGKPTSGSGQSNNPNNDPLKRAVR